MKMALPILRGLLILAGNEARFMNGQVETLSNQENVEDLCKHP